jgi:hypothetical protein
MWKLFEAYGWNVTDYGEFLNLNGVRFTHIPLNLMRKPFANIQIHRAGSKVADRVWSFP